MHPVYHQSFHQLQSRLNSLLKSLLKFHPEILQGNPLDNQAVSRWNIHHELRPDNLLLQDLVFNLLLIHRILHFIPVFSLLNNQSFVHLHNHHTSLSTSRNNPPLDNPLNIHCMDQHYNHLNSQHFFPLCNHQHNQKVAQRSNRLANHL